MSGLVFPESPRWHDHRLWFSDWGAHEVIALDLDGKSEVIARVPSFPMCIDRLPDNYREILILRDIEELSTDESARALRMTPTAVKVRLHRARQALSTLLRKEFAAAGATV